MATEKFLGENPIKEEVREIPTSSVLRKRYFIELIFAPIINPEIELNKINGRGSILTTVNIPITGKTISNPTLTETLQIARDIAKKEKLGLPQNFLEANFIPIAYQYTQMAEITTVTAEENLPQDLPEILTKTDSGKNFEISAVKFSRPCSRIQFFIPRGIFLYPWQYENITKTKFLKENGHEKGFKHPPVYLPYSETSCLDIREEELMRTPFYDYHPLSQKEYRKLLGFLLPKGFSFAKRYQLTNLIENNIGKNRITIGDTGLTGLHGISGVWVEEPEN